MTIMGIESNHCNHNESLDFGPKPKLSQQRSNRRGTQRLWLVRPATQTLRLALNWFVTSAVRIENCLSLRHPSDPAKPAEPRDSTRQTGWN